MISEISEICKIPTVYREGTYGIGALPDTGQDIIDFEHDTYGDTLDYTVPVGEEGRELTLYGIPKGEFLETAKAVYDKTGRLVDISAQSHNEPVLVYIHYADAEDTRQKIRSFALETAEQMIEQICQCTEKIARLFVEYFYDGDAMDIHAKIGTAAQKRQIEEEYDQDSGEYPGNYPSEMMIEGDNDRLIVMVKCSVGGEPYEFFQYARKCMEEHIQEKAIDRINKTDGFRFISMEYD